MDIVAYYWTWLDYICWPISSCLKWYTYFALQERNSNSNSNKNNNINLYDSHNHSFEMPLNCSRH